MQQTIRAYVGLDTSKMKISVALAEDTLVTTAIAREMAAFLWAIGQEVEPRSAG